MKGFEQMIRSMIDNESGGKIIKTIPMKKEWIAKWEKFQEIKKKIEELKTEANSRRRIFWATVEEDTQIFDNMKVNRETNEIEVLED